MSDCDAVALIHEYIHYAPTPEDAVSYVLLAGAPPGVDNLILLFCIWFPL